MRIENAAVLQKKDPDGQKEAKDVAKKAIAAAQTTENNGFSVSLVAAQQTFLEGEDLRFHAVFRNVSDKDFRLYDHPSYYLPVR